MQMHGGNGLDREVTTVEVLNTSAMEERVVRRAAGLIVYRLNAERKKRTEAMLEKVYLALISFTAGVAVCMALRRLL